MMEGRRKTGRKDNNFRKIRMKERWIEGKQERIKKDKNIDKLNKTMWKKQGINLLMNKTDNKEDILRLMAYFVLMRSSCSVAGTSGSAAEGGEAAGGQEWTTGAAP